jgi:AraC-like DNA-binding protein
LVDRNSTLPPPSKPSALAGTPSELDATASAFDAHFASAMGEPPITYLARWCRFRARLLLRESELPLSAIAEQVGYRSAAAFSLAFSREHGVSPGRFSRRGAAKSRSRRCRVSQRGDVVPVCAEWARKGRA